MSNCATPIFDADPSIIGGVMALDLAKSVPVRPSQTWVAHISKSISDSHNILHECLSSCEVVHLRLTL